VLEGVDFELEGGEVHVLPGENGAPESALVEPPSGAYRPDEGGIPPGRGSEAATE
jgi:ribose transport system ATP-binding protein